MSSVIRAIAPITSKKERRYTTMEQDLTGTAQETASEPASTEPDTGPDVQQEGDFQGNY